LVNTKFLRQLYVLQAILVFSKNRVAAEQVVRARDFKERGIDYQTD
jgi:hypothetical protein